MAKGDPAGGRVLRSLVEPPPPVVEDLAPPVRRGRKPGSKNKPKVQTTPVVMAAEPETAAERPRRGRKPGSKNKPKLPVAAAFPPPTAGGPYDAAAAMRSYGFADDGTVWRETSRPRFAEPGQPAPAPVSDAATPDETTAGDGGHRRRLRDRSIILKRYVLDLEPRPGQPGALRARRLARAAR